MVHANWLATSWVRVVPLVLLSFVVLCCSSEPQEVADPAVASAAAAPSPSAPEEPREPTIGAQTSIAAPSDGPGIESLFCKRHSDCIILSGVCQHPRIVNQAHREAVEQMIRRRASVASCSGLVPISVGDMTASCLNSICLQLPGTPEEHACEVDEDCFLTVGLCDNKVALSRTARESFAARTERQSRSLQCGSPSPSVPVGVGCRQGLCVPMY